MNNSEIQIQFPRPGNWREFTLTAIYQDSDGYTRIDRYKQNDIPSGQAPALSAAVAVIADMEEDWQAVQVWARLTKFYAPEMENPMREGEAVELTVEAVNARGGRRMFTSRDYPEFTVASPAAVEFFKFFTTNQ